MYQVVIKTNRPNLPPRYQQIQNHLYLAQANQLAKQLSQQNLIVLIIKNTIKDK